MLLAFFRGILEGCLTQCRLSQWTFGMSDILVPIEMQVLCSEYGKTVVQAMQTVGELSNTSFI